MMENTLPDATGDAKDSLLSRFLSSDHDNDGSNMVAEDSGSSPVLEDDMLLGAEAGHLDPGRRPEITRCKGRMTHMDSTSSDGSRYSIDQLLQDRRPDPEQMLRNLGFAAGSKSESQRRVPVRFLREPSLAKGICLDELMLANHELKECVEASKRLMSMQGTGAHLMAASFKSITHRMRLIGRFASHKNTAQNNSASKPVVLPVELTSPDGKYKYMTILDPENAQYLARQGHYNRVSRHRLKWPKTMPNLQSSLDDPSILPDDVAKTREPVKPSVDTSNKMAVKHDVNENGGEIASLNTPLIVVESNKEYVDLQLDINSNLPAQPVVQSSWQPAGCLIRPIAQNHGALLTQILHRSYSDKSDDSRGRTTGLKIYSKSMDGVCLLKESQDLVGVYDIAKEGLDIRLELSDVETDEQSSADVQSDDSAGELETTSEGRSLTMDKNVGAGSLTGDDDRGEACLTRDGDEAATLEGDREQRTIQEANGTVGGRLFVPSESNWKELLYRRTNWRASPNFTSTHVEPEEAAMAREGLTQLEACTEDQEGSRRVPLLHDNGSQQPSFELEEIESGEEDVVDDTLPVFKRDMVKGSLVRTGSGQSDSSGFVEFAEESEATASFARISSDDCVLLGSFGGSSDSSCTLCGSSEHDRQSSLERARRISQNSDHTHFTTGVTTATTNRLDDAPCSNVIDTTVSISDKQTNVESEDTMLSDSVSTEVSTTSENRVSSPHTQLQECVAVCESNVTHSESQPDSCDEHRQKTLSSAVDDAMSVCSLTKDDNVESAEEKSLISYSTSTAGNDGITETELKTKQLRRQHLVAEATEELEEVQQTHLVKEGTRLQSCLLQESNLTQPPHLVREATRELGDEKPTHLVKEDTRLQSCLLAEESSPAQTQHLVVEEINEFEEVQQTLLVKEDSRLQPSLLAEELTLAWPQHLVAEATEELDNLERSHLVKKDRQLQPCRLAEESMPTELQHLVAEATSELGDGKQTHVVKEDKRLQSCLRAEKLILARQQHVVTEATVGLDILQPTHLVEDDRQLQLCLLAEESMPTQPQHLVAEAAAELHNLQSTHLVKDDRQLQPCLPAEESMPMQPQHVVAEAKQLQEHLVDEVKQVQEAVLRYRLSLQVLETQSSQTYTSSHQDCGEFRDELCNLQELRSDIYQEVTELERLLATRMELVAEGVGIHLHASRTNHQHIVLPTIELLKEQTCHRSITESIASQQLMVQPPERSDMKVDTTDSEIAESRLRPSDDIAPQQMMFGLAMEELKTTLLAEIRSTIRSEMAPLTHQMQVLGDRLTRLESAITNGQSVTPRDDTEVDDVDHGIT